MHWYEPEVRQLERSLARRNAHAHPAVFYGSSSIRLWTTLARDLQSPCAINAGFGGSTLAACVHYFERLVPPLAPASLVVYAGDNDLGDGQSPENVLASFRTLIAKVRKSLDTAPFFFLSIKPSPARTPLLERIRQANALIAAEIGLDPDAEFIDLFSHMLDRAGRPRTELFEPDGLHLNAAGYRVWTEILLPFRNRIFTEHCQ